MYPVGQTIGFCRLPVCSVNTSCMPKPILSIFLTFLLGAGPVAAAPQDTGLPHMSRPVSFDNSLRVHELIRAGNMYLSLRDAIALAIENNLDIELQRYLLPQGDAELLRAKGGGIVRGLNFVLSEVPTGVGGPLSPLVVNRA